MQVDEPDLSEHQDEDEEEQDVEEDDEEAEDECKNVAIAIHITNITYQRRRTTHNHTFTQHKDAAHNQVCPRKRAENSKFLQEKDFGMPRNHSNKTTHTLSLFLSLTHTKTHTYTHSLSSSLSFAHTHTYTRNSLGASYPSAFGNGNEWC